MEIWKDIPNYEGRYQVSDLGRVKSLLGKNEKLMAQKKEKNNYLRIGLRKDGNKKYYCVHQLVAMAFLNHKPDGGITVVDHLDFNRQNNNLDNLRLTTQRENANKKHISSSSKYTGVSWHKGHKKWLSSIQINKKKVFLGYFKTELRASIAYELALLQLDKFNKIIA